MNGYERLAAIEDFVDYLLPELKTYQATVYLYLLRNSFLENGVYHCRIGKRTMATRCGRSRTGTSISYAQMTRVLNSLENMNCIKMQGVNREGTLYEVFLPMDVPMVSEKLAIRETDEDEDCFASPPKRLEIMERDRWKVNTAERQ